MSLSTLKHTDRKYSTVGKQTGAILILFTIGLFALIAVSALAIDSSHLLLNKSRLQNTVDASALSAAKVLQDGGSLLDARTAAVAIINQNLAFNQNFELRNGITTASPDYNATQVTENIIVEFSSGPDPFIATLDESNEFVRVRIENVDLDNFLAGIVGFDKNVRSSAVAGRSTHIPCNRKLVPMMVCAVEVPDPDNPGEMIWGAPPALELYVMKISSQQNDTLGPGNFQLLDLGVSPSDTTLKEAMAGGYNGDVCVEEGDFVETKTGNNVGPVAAGLNMRLGIDTPGQGNLDETLYPPDINTCEGERITLQDDDSIAPADASEAYRFTEYANMDEGAIHNCDIGGIDHTALVGGGRRELEVVIGVCDGSTNGHNTLEVVDTGCFFLTQEVSHQGNLAYVIGEFAATCSGSGNASLDPLWESDSATIVLYRDPDSPDS